MLIESLKKLNVYLTSKILLLLLGIFLTNTMIYAHNHVIVGKIIAKNGETQPITGATVRIENSVLGTITNQKGEFVLKRIPDGKFNIIITAIGFKTITYPIELLHTKGDELLNLSFEMEEAAIATANVVVTATRSQKLYEDSPVKVSIMSNKIFESTQSISLRDGLNFQPGLRIETNCQNCGYSQVRINGLEGSYSQILIDGRPLFSSLNSIYGLEEIPVNMIDRIEVVRGGGSSLYGGNAIAGVINIITKEPTDNSFQASVNQKFTGGINPDNTVQLNTTITNDLQNFGLFLFGTKRHRNPYDNNGDGFSEIGKLDLNTFGTRMYYKPSYHNKLTFEYYNIFHNQRGGNKFNSPPHEADIAEAVSYITNTGGLTYEQYLNSGLDKFSIYGSFQKIARNSYFGAEQNPFAYGNTDNDTYITGLQYSKIITDSSFGEHIVTLGYEFNYDWMKDEALSYSRIIDQLTRNHGIYIQDDWSLNKTFNIILGSRFDKHNFVKDLIISPRANVLIRILTDLSLRTNISTGFRAPQTYDEDLHITQVAGQGLLIKNADNLTEEKSISYGASIDYNFNLFTFPVAFSLEGFYTKLSHAFILENVGIDGNGNIILERRNGSGAKVYGSTLEMQLSKGNEFSFVSGLTVQRSLLDESFVWSSGDENEGIPSQSTKQILRTPDIYAYFTTNFNFFKNFDLNISAVITGPMSVPHYRLEGYDLPDVMKKSVTFVDLSTKLSYKLDFYPNLILSIGAQNLLNSYQNDFDKGVNRDAGYIYGPSSPYTLFFGLKIEQL